MTAINIIKQFLMGGVLTVSAGFIALTIPPPFGHMISAILHIILFYLAHITAYFKWM